MEAQHALLGHLLVYLVVYLSMPPEKYKREFKPWAGYFTTISRIDKGKKSKQIFLDFRRSLVLSFSVGNFV